MPEDKTPLSDEEVENALQTLSGWERDGKFLVKNFTFENFTQINSFLPHMTTVICEQNHHPDLEFLPGKKSVFFRTTTHSHGGLTQADLNLAQALNNWL
tara:strand:- start:123 stop:419 length:297 start_codon:yes stop_codon:yes gene_type:complete